MKLDQETIGQLQAAIKDPQVINETVQILYFDPEFFDLDTELKQHPTIRGFTSREFKKDETMFIVTETSKCQVDSRGIMRLPYCQLRFVLCALFDFFVCNDRGLPMNKSLNSLIEVLSGDYDVSNNYTH